MSLKQADLPLRTRRLTAALDLSGGGIEYGALHSPILPRSVASGIRYVDFADRDFLVNKYAKDPGVDVASIVDVDIVTEGRLIDEFIAPDSLDYVVCSHVAEHVPDLIGWLKANAKVLRKGGCLACAFPDRRYTFDLTRAPTRMADLVSAYLEQRQQPNLQQVASHMIESRNVRSPDIWRKQVTAETAEPKRTMEQALAQLKGVVRNGGYHDVHCWVFSDHEFVEIFRELNAYLVPELELISTFPTARGSNEFMFTLQKVN